MSDDRPAHPPAPQLSAEELNLRNPNHDAFWQARGFKKRPKDWKQRIANEKARKAERARQEQKARARAARREREQAAAARAGDAYDPFRRSQAADADADEAGDRP